MSCSFVHALTTGCAKGGLPRSSKVKAALVLRAGTGTGHMRLPGRVLMEDVMSDKYVDAYVMPVPKSKVDGYKAFSKKIGTFVKKHGALEYMDCIADDVKPGKQTSFPQAVQLGNDETVMLSWAVYKSREDRDKAMKAMRDDPAFKDMGKTMPIDGKRMFMGGFKVLQAF
jgi:uncharacterized protein YbaA (DUF1428 family)